MQTGLVNARPLSRHLQVAVERVMAVYEAAAATEADGAVIAAAVREEAEAICREAEAAEALIGERLVGHLAGGRRSVRSSPSPTRPECHSWWPARASATSRST